MNLGLNWILFFVTQGYWKPLISNYSKNTLWRCESGSAARRQMCANSEHLRTNLHQETYVLYFSVLLPIFCIWICLSNSIQIPEHFQKNGSTFFCKCSLPHEKNLHIAKTFLMLSVQLQVLANTVSFSSAGTFVKTRYTFNFLPGEKVFTQNLSWEKVHGLENIVSWFGKERELSAFIIIDDALLRGWSLSLLLFDSAQNYRKISPPWRFFA